MERLVPTERKRRAIQEPPAPSDTSVDFYTANKEGLNMYVAAQLDDADAAGEFVVGDNKTYGGFINVPLLPDEEYEIWLCAFAVTDTVINIMYCYIVVL